ncbi:uncharacterized protein BCR38DRAFT_445890 [Pseudomassariella vexata]|uniref:Cobalamin-independent methionine synthase MetE C-terminal/archaeal domain-containing protein n=1 Tax=Pseudomassariella vexata TaxID=1141098 RepID=A0A1Y2DJ72_9PEZI|nr:uncharacterized protein BCR38DRAFT_445890 [Pseudomassariella vexata]ORY59194.1 hypothetical protein BCR38DRAFT_445890 [Pseudomassariella vexata]
MAPLFRADQIGSLIRPAALRSARESRTIYSDHLDQDSALEQVTRASISAAVQQQLSLGIRPLTSGEFERTIFFSGLFENLTGMTADPAVPVPDGFATGLPLSKFLQGIGVKTQPAVVATGKIRREKPAYLDAWNMLKATVPEELWAECKMVLPAVTWQHLQLRAGTAYTAEAYGSDEEYFEDLTKAYRAEIRELYDAGLRNIQIDDPQLLYLTTDMFLDGCKADGGDPEKLLDLYIRAHNACLEGKPDDLHIGVHFCKGNMPGGKGLCDASYERISQRLFSELGYETFYLEFDDERSGTFEPLRHVPVGKSVVLGVVSTKTAVMEDIDVLAKRVEEAAAVIASSQERPAADVLQDTLAVSPQCGFSSSTRGHRPVNEEGMWEKLVLLRDLARKLWKDAI